MKAQRPLLLVGPTACGKSDVALLIAQKLGGEIISVDSMQVYRGLDIGTAKPSIADRARMPHHLIDVVELAESFDAAQFAALATEAAEKIRSHGRVPILCGGTGLYFKALLHGLGETPRTDAELRAELANTAIETLLAELAEKDPVTYSQIDRQNPRRVIRAVAVLRLTGKPYSGQKANWKPTGAPEGPFTDMAEAEPAIGILRSMEDLKKRIDHRVDEMFRHGLVEETRVLMARGLVQNDSAMQALGYRQVVEHLQGQRGLEETVSLVKTRTRRFAKRQMTWFRRQLTTLWVAVEPGEPPGVTADRVIAHYRGECGGNASLPGAPDRTR